MNTSVKTAQIASNGKVNITDNMIKTSSEGDIVVKMRACGICGSDLEKVFGSYGMSSSRLGHEPSGEIISVGKEVSSNLSVGIESLFIIILVVIHVIIVDTVILPCVHPIKKVI